MKRIYLDYAAATPVREEVKRAMEEFSDKVYGNASGIYQEGLEAKKALEDSRKKIAKIISARPHEIIFTSGGTEANNLAIFGILSKFDFKGSHEVELRKMHIITSAFEHRSVLEPIHALERRGFKVTYLKISRDGFADPEDVKKALREDTILVSIMYVNNEIGTIQPIREIARIIKNFNKNIIFHTDGCQAAGYLDMSVEKLGVDLMTVSGAKIYGPKGVGFLYKREKVKLAPQIYGGGQEFGYRSGTEPIAQIVGLAKALEFSVVERDSEAKRLKELRDYFADGIIKNVKNAEINGDLKNRIPSNLSVSFLGHESEALIIALDEKGIAVSSGSACDLPRLREGKAGSKLPELPHVIMALGKGDDAARSVIRFSLGKNTRREDIDYVLESLKEIV